MKLSHWYKILPAVCVLAYACAPSLMRPLQEELPLAHQKFSHTSMDSLNRGYELYVSHCGGCHTLFLPTAHKEEEWKKILPEMAEKARLNSSEVELVFQYLAVKSAGTSKNHQ